MKRKGTPPRDRGPSRDSRRDHRDSGRDAGKNAGRKKSESHEASRESRGAFVFTDRAGKQHTIGGRGAARDPEPRGKTPRKEESRPAPRARDDREERGSGRFGRDRNRDRNQDRDRERPHSKKFGRGRDRDDSRDEGRRGKSRREEHTGKRGRGPRGQARRERERGDFGPLTKLKATVDKNRKGFGFLQFENREYEDAFLNPYEAEKFFHGDRVEALVSERGEVVELRVIAHRFRELVGRFYPVGKNGMVVYERKRAREEVPVVGDRKGAKSREWVRAKMVYPEAESEVASEGNESDDFDTRSARASIACEIQEVYGEDLPARADIQMVSAEYNLVEAHSPEAVAEAESFKLDLEDPHRVDLRHLPFITIDGETARDFDDAIYVERTKSGGYVLWVAIADVSHYVTDGTALNDEAYSRATSVYFPERAFHMLPRALSENLCSLRPKEPRLTMTSRIEYDRNGKKIGVEVMNTLIESRRRATYNEIQAEAEKREKDPSWEYVAHFELYRILRRLRNERGSIDFDLPEAEVRVDSTTGEPISIKNRPRLDAHRLIEEFMIAANESVTEWALERRLPFLYRVHDEPPRPALVRFQELCAHYGVNFALPGESAKGGDRGGKHAGKPGGKHGGKKAGGQALEKRLADALNAVVRSLEEHPAQTMLNNALLRSMAQAHYSSVYGEHFGLASTAYTHFTSPIRRYPDLVVHRMLKLALEAERTKKPMADHERDHLEEELFEIAEHCSYRERIASDAERESIKLKQVRIMIKEIGNEFPAKIMGMIESGLFAGIPDPFVEGFISQDSMHDDFYTYNEDRQVFVGRRKKRTFKIGDEVRVRVDRVDLDLRRIDLTLLDTETARDADEDEDVGSDEE